VRDESLFKQCSNDERKFQSFLFLALQFITGINNGLCNCMDIKSDVIIRKANYLMSTRFQVFSSCHVVFLLCFFQMGIAVDLNAQFYFGAIKIYDEKIKGMLPAKFIFQISIP
jgi:hypothetical protein